jgi:LysM repeat protein
LISQGMLQTECQLVEEGLTMELQFQELHLLKKGEMATSQITMDEDVIVPDKKPDVGRLIQEKGELQIDETRAQDGYVQIKGQFLYKLLYVSEDPEKKVVQMDGAVPFSERLNLKNAKNQDKVCLLWDIEDLTVTLLNSRKLNLKSVITFQAYMESVKTLQIPVDLKDGGDISRKKRELSALDLQLHRRDMLRIREELPLPSNKPNIQTILWEDVELRGLDIREEKGKINIRGELFLFLLYDGEEGDNLLQWMEQSIPFQQTVECPECEDGMISNMDFRIISKKVQVKPDSDGEERILQSDIHAELNMNLYKEKQMGLLLDVYTPLVDCEPVSSPEQIQKLLMKNYSKCRINERIPMDSDAGKVLQVCHSEGNVKIDQTALVEEGILVEGAVEIRILYIISDDNMPFYSMKAAIPFSHVIESQGGRKHTQYELQTDLEQLSLSMPDSSQVEVKMVVNLNAIVLENQEENIITDIQEHELEEKKIQEMPGVVGYRVQPEDTLWDIAKKFYTTMDSIRELNDLSQDEPEPYDTLLIVKKVEG